MTIFQVFLAVTSSRDSCFSGSVTAAIQGTLHQWIHFSDCAVDIFLDCSSVGQMATQQQIDAGISQAALLQIAEATQAAATAAQAAASARSSTAGTASSSASENATIDWSKLVNKPQVFDHASQEQDQRHYRDWLWQLTQYLICVDEGFSRSFLKLQTNLQNR